MVRKQNQTKALSLPAPHFPGSTPCLHSQFFSLMLYPGLPRVAPCPSSSPSSSSDLPTPGLCLTFPSLLSRGFPYLGCTSCVCPQLHWLPQLWFHGTSSNCVPSLFSQLSQGLGLPSTTVKPLSGLWVFLENIFIEKETWVVQCCWVSSVVYPRETLVLATLRMLICKYLSQ